MGIESPASLVNIGGVSKKALEDVSLGAPLERDPSAPTYEILVRGGVGAQPFTLTDEVKKYISEITYEDNSDQFAHLTIKLENQVDDSGGGQILSLVDSKLLCPGTILEIRMGYGNSLMTVGACEVIRLTPDFPDSGFPTLTIEGYDLLHRAARRRPRGGVSYKGSRDSQIASIIGERNGFDVQSNDPRSFESIKKTGPAVNRGVQNRGMSDYEYLKKIADLNGFDLFSRFDPEKGKFVLFFQPPATAKQKEVYTFTYNIGDLSYQNTLLSFSPTLDAYDQSSDFEIFVIKDKETSATKFEFINRLGIEEQAVIKEEQDRKFTGSIGRNGGQQKGSNDGVHYAFKAFGRSFKFLPHIRFQTEFAARNAMQQFIKRQKENFITANGRIIGTEALQSRQVHNLQGLGSQFSGKYFFSKVTHTMSKSDGYHVEFAARKVIDDVIVQAPPAFNITENDKTFERVQGNRDKRSTSAPEQDEEE